MTDKILFTGNCHAQYFGAAFKHLGLGDVRVLGRAFNGPIQFDGTNATMVTQNDMMNWFAQPGCGGRNILVMQTTPMGRYTLDAKIKQKVPDLITIKIPYLKFDTIYHRKTSSDPLRMSIRGDKIFNELSLRKAQIDPSLLTTIMEYISVNPCLYTNNHFSGGLYAKILSFCDLSHVFSAETKKDIISAIASDAGIAHDNVGMPSDDVIAALGLNWPTSIYKDTLQELQNLSCAQLSKTGLPRDPNKEFAVYLYWRGQFSRAKKSGDRAALLRSFLIYKSQSRLYRPWFRNLANLLLENGKPGLAAIIAAHRMEYNDFRGQILSWCLENIASLEKSHMATRAFSQSAKRVPTSNSAIVNDILKALSR